MKRSGQKTAMRKLSLWGKKLAVILVAFTVFQGGVHALQAED